MVGLYDSSSSSSSAVEEIISEAKDSILLQQISAINCASFTHSHLPTDLESRFNKLKSFPANHTPPPPYYPNSTSTSTSTLPPNPTNTSPSKSNPIQNHPHSSPSQNNNNNNNNNHLKPLPKPKQKQPSLSPSSSSSSHTSEDSSLFMPTAKTEKHKLSKQNSLWGCFWCSPKKDKNKSRSSSKEENVLGLEFDSTDKILSGLGSLSMKEHQKVIKKAMKEEEKISREAEKIVEWAKHVSARINISDIEDELSDN